MSSYSTWSLFLAAFATSTLAVLQGELNNRPDIYHELSQEVFTGQANSLFGYSIGYQKKIKQLIVGSPAEDSLGQVYLCPALNITKKDNNCIAAKRRVKIDEMPMGYNFSFWFGARVDAGSSFYMACAPRHAEKISGLTTTKGRCYWYDVKDIASSEPELISEVTDLEKEKYDYHTRIDTNKDIRFKPESLSDSFGWSSHVLESETIPLSETVFVGGPAMSIGRVFKHQIRSTGSDLISVNNHDLLEPGKNKPVSFNFGYSITSGYFKDHELQIAISTPYGSIGYGRVYFYDNSPQNELLTDMSVDGKEHTGVKHVEVGSLFGACLASLKLQKQESILIVGAPAAKDTQAIGFDVGAVFVYRFKSDDILLTTEVELVTKLVPVASDGEIADGGRFGASIITVGDFDGDNIEEVAVAAPFENNGRGAVYIYSSKLLLNGDNSKTPLIQRLLPKESGLFYYGLSLTALQDSDENGCNELAIGAPANNSVTLLRCIASVTVEFLDIELTSILTEKSAQITNGIDTSFDYNPCLSITYGDYPKPETIKTIFSFTIKVIHPSVTIESADNNSTTKTVKSSHAGPSSICIPVKVLLPQDGDYDREIKFEMSVNVDKNPLTETNFDPGYVLVNKKLNDSKLTTINASILPVSNVTFQILTTFKNNYTIGSSYEEQLTIFMTNFGNAAHGVCVRTRLGNVAVAEMPRTICSVASNQLTCTIEKLKINQTQAIKVNLSMKNLSSSDERFELISELFTSNCQLATNKFFNTSISLRRDTNIVIKADKHSNVSVTQQDLDTNGKNIDHKYTITNNGVTLWKNSECVITLPTQVKIEKVAVTSGTCNVRGSESFCNITQLAKNIPVVVTIQMKIEPGSSFAGIIKNGKATVDTSFKLKLTDEIHPERTITTIVTLWEPAKVPLWMIVAAVLIGVVMVFILLWVLRECGCMQRENKQKLKELQKEVHRQSVRRSMMIRQSGIKVIPNKTVESERQMLLDVLEENTRSHQGDESEDDDRINIPTVEETEGNEKPLNDNQQYTKQQPKSVVNEVHTKNVFNEQAKDMVNAKSVKETHFDDNDPARIAFKAELAKTLGKGGDKFVTEAKIH